MADTLYMEIITPERVMYRGDVKNISAPGAYGEFMVLPDHAAFFTSLGIGKLRFLTAGSEEQWAAVHKGYFEVLDNRITILADRAELAQEIDVERALQSKARAEERLKEWGGHKSQEDQDIIRAQSSLDRALVREECFHCAKPTK
jgi:F-type H+-transporting ATPase subunit epsilon